MIKGDNKKVWGKYSDLKRNFEDKVIELEILNGKLDR